MRPLLPPITRRRFVTQLVGAGAALTLADRLSAADRQSNPTVWALLSDLHVAADPATVRNGVNMADHLSAVTQEILALPELPGHLLVTGDLASVDGQTDDYATVAKLLAPAIAAPMPVHVIPGNHDVRDRIRQGLPKLAESADIPDKYTGVIRAQNANWFLLDSSVKTDFPNGILGEAQRQWLTQQLDANPNTPAILAFHHPPAGPSPQTAPALQDAKELLEIIRPRKQVKACLFGHTHVYGTAQDQSGVHLINLPAVAYAFDPKNPTGWVLATLATDGIRLEFHCSERKHSDSGKVTDLKWRSGA